MSYQKIELVYGETINNEDCLKIKNILIEKLTQVSKRDDDDNDDDSLSNVLESFGLVCYDGYYNDTIKIGIGISNEEVRSMQDFVFDFSIPDMDMLKEKVENNKELFESIGLNIENFTLGVCTYNY